MLLHTAVCCFQSLSSCIAILEASEGRPGALLASRLLMPSSSYALPIRRRDFCTVLRYTFHVQLTELRVPHRSDP